VTPPHLLGPTALEQLTSAGSPYVHVVTVATKPDIIKQAPVYRELAARGEPVLVFHSDQHWAANYSGDMLEEFGMPVHLRLGQVANTRPGRPPSLSAKTAQIVGGFGELLAQLKESRLVPVPYIHGDTATSMAVGVASYLNQVACAHVEAGIRTITPTRDVFQRFLDDFAVGRFDVEAYAERLREPATYEQGSREPFPEQFNTRVSDAGSGYHAAAVELNRLALLDEGFPADTVEVVGNTVVDATRAAQAEAERATIFDTYPQLRGGGFVRVCIHRRENTDDPRRFRVLFEAIEDLVRRGTPVLFIRLFGTEAAIDRYGLRRRLEALEAAHPDTFISSPVWPYYRDVIAAMQQCALVATDSGSMQEEMNILGIPCVTLRFGSDRGETLLAGGNLLAPPVDAGFVAAVVEGALGLPGLGKADELYGEDVSARIVDGVLSRLDPSTGLFRPEDRRLGFSGP
jgi:UDP-N-acetylglucosamine 2-epimerase (non-hydrolysing)